MTEIEAMLIERACARLQTLYCIHADRRETEAFVQLFAEDGSVAVPEHPAFVGHEAIRWSIEALAALPVAMRHVMTNSVIDVIDADNATGLCYLTVWNSAEPADENGWRPIELPGTVGEYHDVFRRTPAGWRFASRQLTRVFRKFEKTTSDE
jgi:hypothetical protein